MVDPMHLQMPGLDIHARSSYTTEADSQQLLKQSGAEDFALHREMGEWALRSMAHHGQVGKWNGMDTFIPFRLAKMETFWLALYYWD